MKFFALMSLILCLSPRFVSAQSVTVDCATEYQKIRGFGGMNMPGWIADLTTDQVKLAYGNGDGQLGLSILRVKVPSDATCGDTVESNSGRYPFGNLPKPFQLVLAG